MAHSSWAMQSAQLGHVMVGEVYKPRPSATYFFFFFFGLKRLSNTSEVSLSNPLPPHLPHLEVKISNARKSVTYSPLCYHLSPQWPGVFHSRWMCRSRRFHRIWHNDPLLKPEWVLVSDSFQDPPKFLTSLHSWNVWDMVLLRKQRRQKAQFIFVMRTDMWSESQAQMKQDYNTTLQL